jgi:hypothetical protein
MLNQGVMALIREDMPAIRTSNGASRAMRIRDEAE